MDANFFGPPTEQGDPQTLRAQGLARMLMQQGSTSPQGQMAGGQYVAPSPASYVAQIGSGALGGMMRNTLARNSAINAANQSADPIASIGQSMGRENGMGSWLRGLLGGG